MVTWKGSSWLEQSARKLSAYYNIPPIAEGAVVMAVGSSFPEISTTVISALVHDEFELGVATIMGSAIFNVLVIPAVSGLVSKKINVSRDLVLKDGQFYMMSISVLLVVFCIAIVYFPVEGTPLSGKINRWMALFPILTYLLYIYLQGKDISEHNTNPARDKDVKTGQSGIGKIWVRFLTSLVIIILGVEGLIRSVIFFGEQLDTPGFFWGATVLAAVTSAPDAVVSIRVGLKNKGNTSVGNVFGSNTFDLLVAVPVGVMVAGTSTINFSNALPLIFFLMISTLIFLAIARRNLAIHRTESVFLLLLYLAFLIWIFLETFLDVNWFIG